jgi:hypothetical protein
MNYYWAYLSGVCIILIIAGGMWLWGWNVGSKVGKREGDREGYNRGFRQGQKQVEQEKLANPFHKRMNQANRRALPRPDSAGPIRVHRARITGDHRLPTNRSLEEQRRILEANLGKTKLNPPTKLNPSPTSEE